MTLDDDLPPILTVEQTAKCSASAAGSPSPPPAAATSPASASAGASSCPATGSGRCSAWTTPSGRDYL